MTQQKEDFIFACENALHYCNGVPAAIIPDNLKSAVTKAVNMNLPPNETFADFAEYYELPFFRQELTGQEIRS